MIRPPFTEVFVEWKTFSGLGRTREQGLLSAQISLKVRPVQSEEKIDQSFGSATIGSYLPLEVLANMMRNLLVEVEGRDNLQCYEERLRRDEALSIWKTP